MLAIYGKYLLFFRFTHFRKNRDDMYCIRVSSRIFYVNVEDKIRVERRKTLAGLTFITAISVCLQNT
jgi:hypothetical protein